MAGCSNRFDRDLPIHYSYFPGSYCQAGRTQRMMLPLGLLRAVIGGEFVAIQAIHQHNLTEAVLVGPYGALLRR